MTDELGELAARLDRVSEAMDAETEAVRSGRRDELSAASARKHATIESLRAILREHPAAVSVTTPAEGGPLARAAQRLRAATERNGATLQGALDGTRRLLACVAEAARAASSTGTYGPDGSLRRSAELAGMIRRSA